jgi:hypothetical protein
MTNWKIVEVKDIECTMDNSGIYCVINRVIGKSSSKGYSCGRIEVRCDIMDQNDMPIRSYKGSANAVRKHVIKFIGSKDNKNLFEFGDISIEHASYIGFELIRAEKDVHYIQD